MNLQFSSLSFCVIHTNSENSSFVKGYFGPLELKCKLREVELHELELFAELLDHLEEQRTWEDVANATHHVEANSSLVCGLSSVAA